MKKVFVIFTLVALCSTAWADKSISRTVQWLHDGWVQSQKIAQGNRGEKQDAFLAGQYVGYVTAETDLIRSGLMPEIEIPPTVTYNEVLAVVGDYLDAHPTENGSAAALIAKAFQAVWPARD